MVLKKAALRIHLPRADGSCLPSAPRLSVFGTLAQYDINLLRKAKIIQIDINPKHYCPYHPIDGGIMAMRKEAPRNPDAPEGDE